MSRTILRMILFAQLSQKLVFYGQLRRRISVLYFYKIGIKRRKNGR